MKRHAQRWEHVAGAAHHGEPSIRTPCPVSDNGINESGNRQAVYEVSDEARPADHSAGSNRGAGVGEGELENPNGEKRHPRRFISIGRALQEEPVIADEAVAMTEHECKTDGIEENTAKAGIYDALHEDVDCLTRPAKARFQHRETDLHTEDQ